jgi:hypothetical protein
MTARFSVQLVPINIKPSGPIEMESGQAVEIAMPGRAVGAQIALTVRAGDQMPEHVFSVKLLENGVDTGRDISVLFQPGQSTFELRERLYNLKPGNPYTVHVSIAPAQKAVAVDPAPPPAADAAPIPEAVAHAEESAPTGCVAL